MELDALKYHHTISCFHLGHEWISQLRRVAISVLVGIFSLIGTGSSLAAILQTTDTVSVSVNFRQGHSDLDTAYMGNGEALRRFANTYHTLTCDSAHINIYGYASPEGSIRINQSLSQRRADAIARLLVDDLMVDPLDITKVAGGVDWVGLYNAVKADSKVPQQQRVLEIITSVGDSVLDRRGRLVSSRKQQLMKLDGGRPWDYMYRNIFPHLRGAYADVFCVVNTELLERLRSSASPIASVYEAAEVSFAAPSRIVPAGVTIPPVCRIARCPWIAFRSNLLLPLLNFGVELPVAKHWSIGADYYYPWIWPAKSNKNCFELTFFSLEARYWFRPDKGRVLPGRNYLQGHSIGAYGAWGYYDFERNFHGHQGQGWSGGIDYLFSLPIAGDRLRLEFQAAIGYVWSPKSQPYTVYESGGRLIRDAGLKRNYSYFGPTKLAVSLVLPLCRILRLSTPTAK